MGSMIRIVIAITAYLFCPLALAGQPQQAVIYRDGYAVLEEVLGSKAQQEGVRLPVGTDLMSVQVLQQGKRLGSLDIEKLEEEVESNERTIVQDRVVIEKRTTEKKHVGYLLRFGQPRAGTSGKLTLRYGVVGISWQPQIHTEVLDAGRVLVTLTGLVNNSELDLNRCRVKLASAAGPLSSKIYFSSAMLNPHRTPGQVLTRSADQVYDAGLTTIKKDRSAVITLLSGIAPYERKLVWHTDSRERVQVVLMVKNPFEVPLCPAPVNLYRDGVLISRDDSEWAPPRADMVLAGGQAPDIEVERSVDTKENLANKARPFTHDVKFRVANHGERPARLEVVMPKKIGSRHKTLYHFKRKPDRRPGSLFIWELDLNKSQSTQIIFQFESEYARFSGYESYEKARFEMH